MHASQLEKLYFNKHGMQLIFKQYLIEFNIYFSLGLSRTSQEIYFSNKSVVLEAILNFHITLASLATSSNGVGPWEL